MRAGTRNSANQYIWIGALVSAALTAIIGLTAVNLSGFEIVGKTVPFAYPWRLTEHNAAAHLTAWAGYLLHNVLAWGIIFFAQWQKPKYGNNLRWFNWAMITVNVIFGLLHVAQTRYYYDGLAQSVPEVTALGSVAVMLVFIIILETPRRGLILGYKFKFHDGFMYIVRKYHSYFTQMYGLGLSTWTKRMLAIGFLVAVVAYYGLWGEIASINEVIRIPFIDYTLIFVLYGMYLLINRLVSLLQRSPIEPAATE